MKKLIELHDAVVIGDGENNKFVVRVAPFLFLHINKPPNILHRIMQYLFFGFVYFIYGGPLDKERIRLEEWHPWFAWKPVRLEGRDCRWLEWVQRRGKYILYRHCFHWEYKAI